MERAFIVAPECKFFEAYKKYLEGVNAQREIVKAFMDEKGIESTKFDVTGQGVCGVPFTEREKENIRLGIIPTSVDKEKFGKYLKAPNKYGVSYFKANTAITKEIAQKLVVAQVVVNLWRPRLGDYFKSVGWKGHQHRYFEHDGTYYASIDCDTLDLNETPDGFTEIKMSELYKVIETIEEQRK